MKLFHGILAAFAIFASPLAAQTELVASKNDPKYASLRPLTNGLSALSLMWPLNSLAENRIEATHAGLATIVNGPTPAMTAFEADTYREINGIDFGITLLPSHIMLTLSAPSDGFADAIGHMSELITSPDFSRQWYARQTVQQRPLLATKTRRPGNVTGVLSDFILFPEADDGTDTANLSFQFGMPSQIVVRHDGDVQGEVTDFLRQLPRQNPDALQPTAVVTDLPKGVIYVPDPSSRETLMFLVKSETFDGAEDFVGANMLMDYMGAYQGSEMFRIIRQELRAAYNPTADFEQLGKNRALMSLSATVQSSEWPKILEEMKGIYNRVRNSDATDQGMRNVKRRALNGLEYRFSTNARWGASQFMDEYAEGVTGQIRFPVFSAVVNANVDKIRDDAMEHLPPLDDYLLILIGGSNPPPDAMKANGYCEQPISKPLRHCLTQMR